MRGRPVSAGTVSVIDGATCNARVTSGCDNAPPTVTVGNDNGLAGLAVDPATHTIYVVNAGDDTVSVFNGATCNGKITSGCDQTPDHVSVGRQVYGFVAVDRAKDLVYVSNTLDDTVSIIDGTNCKGMNTRGFDQIPPTVPAGANPAGLAIGQSDHTVYVDDNGAGTASFFRFEAPRRTVHDHHRSHPGTDLHIRSSSHRRRRYGTAVGALQPHHAVSRIAAQP